MQHTNSVAKPLVIAALAILLAAGAFSLLRGRPDRHTASEPTPLPSPSTPASTATFRPVQTAAPTPQQTQAVQPASSQGESLYYNRAQLNASDQAMYDQLSRMLSAHETQTELLCDDVDRPFEVYKYVLLDHPAYFWVDGSSQSSYYEENGRYRLTFMPHYTMTRTEADRYQQKLDVITERLRQQFGSKSDYDKVKGVYEYIIDHAYYDYGADEQSLIPVLLEGHGVCASYAKSTQYLLQQLGVQTLYVSGNTDGEPHGWNVVKIDGDYYHLDTTWGDPIMPNGEQVLRYDYFCLTSAEISLDHSLDPSVFCPECTAVKANYFRQEGRYFTSCDRNAIIALFERDAAARQPVRFRAADAAVMRDIFHWLIDEGGVFDILSQMSTDTLSSNSSSYSQNELLNIMEIGLEYT